ncbi:hypothetical protein ACIHCQ_32535 [Streptomyces sp. NPDC052236]
MVVGERDDLVRLGVIIDPTVTARIDAGLMPFVRVRMFGPANSPEM